MLRKLRASFLIHQNNTTLLFLQNVYISYLSIMLYYMQCIFKYILENDQNLTSQENTNKTQPTPLKKHGRNPAPSNPRGIPWSSPPRSSPSSATRRGSRARRETASGCRPWGRLGSCLRWSGVARFHIWYVYGFNYS